jgi:transcriptional regulator with XRE-family HTH domain
MKVLARRLVKFRDLRRMSQTALAGVSGVSRKNLNSLEAGLAADTLASTIEALSHSLGVTPDALLGYDDLPLVRMTVSHDYAAVNAREFMQGRACQVCGFAVPARTLHPMGECLMSLSDKGHSAVAIGVLFGLRAAGVERLLDDEHEARRRRRF